MSDNFLLKCARMSLELKFTWLRVLRRVRETYQHVVGIIELLLQLQDHLVVAVHLGLHCVHDAGYPGLVIGQLKQYTQTHC